MVWRKTAREDVCQEDSTNTKAQKAVQGKSELENTKGKDKDLDG